MKYSIKCQIIKRKISQKVYPLAIRVSFAGIRIDLRLGVSIPEKCWDGARQMAVSKSAKEKTLCANANKAIFEATEKIEQAFVRCEVIENRYPTPDELKEALAPKGDITKFAQVSDMYLDDSSHLEYNSIVAYRCAIKSFVVIEGDVVINDISEAVMQDYCIKSLINHANSTVRTRCIMICSILRWAQKKGLYKGDALKFEFKYKVSEKPVIHLTEEELMRFYAYRPVIKTERIVQLMYLFCCFSGLRYSDALRLTWNQVHEKYFDFVTKKTNDLLKIELNLYSFRILEICREEIKYDNDGASVFPKVDLASYEIMLRRMFRRIGCDEMITIEYYRGSIRESITKPKYQFLTSHTARKTFVVNAFTLGVPVEVIMRWTGHKSLKALAPYMKIVDEVKETQMHKFDSFGK